MNESQDNLNSLRSTGAEADRFLKSLEADQAHTQQKPAHPHPAESIQQEYTPNVLQEQENRGIGMPIIIFLMSSLFLVWLLQMNSQESVSPASPLRFSRSCGSPPGAGKRWWPVLGRANRQLLQSIRTSYCGDAYINEQGALQVASFDSWNGAEAFRLRLEAATGTSFRVGQER